MQQSNGDQGRGQRLEQGGNAGCRRGGRLHAGIKDAIPHRRGEKPQIGEA